MTSRQPLRVAMIGQKGYPAVQGGIEKHVAELAARLPGLGVEVDLYSRPHYSSARGLVDLPGVRVLRLPSLATKHLDAISHTIVCTGDAMFRRPDVVHYHALGPGLLSGIPRWLRGIPTVVTVHGLDWQREKWGRFARSVLHWGERASVVFPDATVVVSQALAEYYQIQYGVRPHYIPNGISVPAIRPPDVMRQLELPEKYVLFVGRLVPEKGCHLLLSAWQSLPQEIRQGRELVIAGDDGFSSNYVDSLKAQNIPGTRFLGFVHGPLLAELYSNAELLVLPSTLEGLSIALLEGMSYQRCCLVSDIPPNLEAAGECAVFFPSGDIGQLGNELASLLGNPDHCRKIGLAAAERVGAEYSWPRVSLQTAEVYRGLIS